MLVRACTNVTLASFGGRLWHTVRPQHDPLTVHATIGVQYCTVLLLVARFGRHTGNSEWLASSIAEPLNMVVLSLHTWSMLFVHQVKRTFFSEVSLWVRYR